MAKRKFRGKSKSILEYLSDNSASVDDSSSSPSADAPSEESSEHEYIDAILRELAVERKRIASTALRDEGKVESSEQFSELLAPLSIPRGPILDDILNRDLSEDRGAEDIKCSSDGSCSDGKSIGEVFADEYGYKRKRGYVNTTRLPIFLDWILEEGVANKIMPKAVVVKTNSGSVAIVPEDFICEFQYRYGVSIKNYDKCANYRPSIRSSSEGKRRKKEVSREVAP